MPTTFRFTGQREEYDLGLYFYQSRWYDPYLNRWIQPDNIIPDPYNSTDWDRYAYVRNNPLRYVDTTGNFSEDQIKEFLGFSKDDSWEDVLKLFEEGGKYANRWGWLETLRRAEIGDQITIEWLEGILPEGHPSLTESLTFELDPQGNLILSGDGFYVDQEIAGLYGEKYELKHYETNTGKRVAAAFLVAATDLTVGIPSFLAILSGNPVLMKAGEYLEYTVVLPVNLLAVKMWSDADREKFEVLTVQAISATYQP